MRPYSGQFVMAYARLSTGSMRRRSQSSHSPAWASSSETLNSPANVAASPFQIPSSSALFQMLWNACSQLKYVFLISSPCGALSQRALPKQVEILISGFYWRAGPQPSEVGRKSVLVSERLVSARNPATTGFLNWVDVAKTSGGLLTHVPVPRAFSPTRGLCRLTRLKASRKSRT